jgi:pimeloyl-ACP methyl ester carboxylesterase
VAVDLAARRPHRALVLVRTFTSVPDVAQAHSGWLPVRWLVSNRFDNREKLRSCKQPVLIAQAEDDPLVPPEHGRQLLAAAGPHATLVTLQKCGHNDPLGPKFYAALRHFLKEGAPGSPAPATAR